MRWIKNVKLTDFRCYSNNSFEFSNGINIICGDNATGKTSLMESLYIGCMCKSYRTSQESEIIKYGKAFYNIHLSVADNKKTDNINVIYNNGTKKISFNSKTYKTLSEHLGYLSMIVFSPDDLKLINGEPKHRRKFIDVNLSFLNKDYLTKLSNYNKILKERNELLKKINYSGKTIDENSKSLLKIYTKQLVNVGTSVIKYRDNFINELNSFVSRNIFEISSGKETGIIKYIPNISIEKFEEEINNKIYTDLYAQNTSIGPHRDDFITIINDKDAKDYASQGQQRTIALSIKIGLAEYIRSANKDMIIVLDDVFGEIDEKRQKCLVKLLKNDNQIFITTTTMKHFDDKIISESKVIKI